MDKWMDGPLNFGKPRAVRYLGIHPSAHLPLPFVKTSRIRADF
jgi:hypothetical protein